MYLHYTSTLMTNPRTNILGQISKVTTVPKLPIIQNYKLSWAYLNDTFFYCVE